MSMWTAKEKSLNYDQAKAEAARAQKDIKMVNQFIQTTIKLLTIYRVCNHYLSEVDRPLPEYFYD